MNKNISKAQLDKLIAINAKLAEVEKDIIKQCKKYHKQASAQKDKNIIVDFELDPIISYYCGDNLIYKCEWASYQGLEEYKKTDWNTTHREELSAFEHCWLFHDLYDHAFLTFSKISKITCIWWDIKVMYQNRIDLD